MASNQGPATPNEDNTTGTTKKELKHRNRLQEIVSPTKSHEFDIVAIHGLGGDAIESWRDPDTKYMWLTDCLPEKFPTARIFTYGYESGRVWFSTESSTIESESVRLLAALKNDLDPKRLVVFICHSMGGILLKVAMVTAKNQERYSFLIKQPKVAMFMATPHLGSKIASYLDHLVKIPLPPTFDTANIQNLKSHSPWLLRLSDIFEERKGDFVTGLSLFERKYLKDAKELVVNEQSASFPPWGKIAIEKDHSSICRFASEDDDELVIIIPQLEEIIERGKKEIIERGKKSITGYQQQQFVREFSRYPNARETQSLSYPSPYGGGVSPGETGRLGLETSAPRGSAVSVWSCSPPASEFSNRSIEKAGGRASPSTAPTWNFDVSGYTSRMADARKEFVGKQYWESYARYRSLYGDLKKERNDPSGGSAGDQIFVLACTATLAMTRCCVKLYVLEEEERINCGDTAKLEKIADCQKGHMEKAVKLLDALTQKGFKKLSRLDLAASELGRGLCGEVREFAKDVEGLDSYREELRKLLELAVEVRVFFEGRIGPVAR